MKKIILLFILFILVGYLIFSKFLIQFVWVNPNVNKVVLPYISKAVKEVDNAIKYASKASGTKILYQDAYGSGFLKENPIPNDLDYSIGIYLGKYNFDGNNGTEIANDIENKMTNFQSEFYNYINVQNPGKFYSDYDVVTSIQNLGINKKNNINKISTYIPQMFKYKDYVLYTQKSMYDENKVLQSVVFPFIMKKNEILIEDYAPIELYTSLIKYSPNTRNILRELSIVPEFYADITQGKDKVRVEIVAESYTGQRLQLKRRFFVPIVFVGNSSASFLTHYNLLKNDDDYIEYRLFNLKRHLQEVENLNEIRQAPIKLFKRVAQCTDLISPLLEDETKKEIQTIIYDNLNNPKIKYINDYETAYSNLMKITNEINLFQKVQYSNDVISHIDSMNKIVEEMEKSGEFSKEDIKVLSDYTKKLKSEILIVNSEIRLQNYRRTMRETGDIIIDRLDKIVQESSTNTDKIFATLDLYKQIVNKSGFHRVDMCWLDKDLLGVVKDDYTKTIPESDLNKMAVQNKFPDVKYKFITLKEYNGPKIKYSVWVRYNSTNDENEYYEQCRQKLLKDKKCFNIKRTLKFTY